MDLPTGGEVARWAGLVRLLVPVALGAAAASWLVSRGGPRPAPPPAPPPSRPGLALAGHLAAFAATAAGAWRLLGPGAPPPGVAGLLLLLAGAAATALLALATTAPLGGLWRAAWPGKGAAALVLLVGLAAFGTTAAAERAWGLLSSLTLRAVAGLLRPWGGEVLLLPAERAIGLDGFEVEVSPECSGIEGIGLVVLFQAVWLALARERVRFPRALLLLPAGVAAAFSANAVRLALLLQVGASGHEALALGGLHSKLGWVLFLGIALASVALAEHSGWLRRAGAPTGTAVPEAAIPLLVPFLATLATALVTGLWAGGPLDGWYGARVAVAAAALAFHRRALPPLGPSRSFLTAAAGVAVGLCWVALSAGGVSGLGEAVAGLAPGPRAAWLAARLLGALVAVPLVEELAFRGFLLPWLASPDLRAELPAARAWPAVLLSSLAFGAIHPQWLLGTGAGLAFAAARLWRGRLGDAVLAHACANAVVAAAALSGRWALWG